MQSLDLVGSFAPQLTFFTGRRSRIHVNPIGAAALVRRHPINEVHCRISARVSYRRVRNNRAGNRHTWSGGDLREVGNVTHYNIKLIEIDILNIPLLCN